MTAFIDINPNDALAHSELRLGYTQDKDNREYVYLNNIPVGMFTNDKPNELLQIHTDHLGTPRAVTNKAKQVLWRWDERGVFWRLSTASRAQDGA